jgi:two-component system cell cycle response regulator DivK
VTTLAAPLILLVDDFADALEMYEEYLCFKGFRVVTATNGPSAIEIATAERPALILMDLQLAGMTGTEAMRLLRADARFDPVPIIAFTAHAFDDERVEALSAGFDEVVAKPCLPDDLVGAVNRLLARFAV